MGISERIMSLCLQTTDGNVNLVSAHARILGASPDVKGSIYEAVADTVANQRIHWPRALGYHGIGKMKMARGC